jgi:3-oxoacyl-[acyl-carrier-protein] synthase I
MRRVVITGMGVVSCLGTGKAEVTEALREGKSGIGLNEEYRKHGFRCHVSGNVKLELAERIPKKIYRFMGRPAALSYIAMEEAVADSGLTEDQIRNPRVGAVLGAGGTWAQDIIWANQVLAEKGVRKIGPYKVTSTMGNSVSACLSTAFGVQGVSYSVTSACSTSAHCVGNAAELIQWGKQDIVFAGGGEGEHYSMSCKFDAMGAFSTKFNDTPERASRPYDADRDGFVISEGGGVVVLEEFEHAKRRGAHIYAELVGYGATSDGYDMVAPSGEGGVRAMRMALEEGRTPIDYINSHGTSTQVGDITELRGITEVFGGDMPWIGSTKSLAGHSLGATGVHEVIYSLLMMKERFMAASANIERLDPEVGGARVLLEARHDVDIRAVMSNSFGFGGTNAVLVLKRI